MEPWRVWMWVAAGSFAVAAAALVVREAARLVDLVGAAWRGGRLPFELWAREDDYFLVGPGGLARDEVPPEAEHLGVVWSRSIDEALAYVADRTDGTVLDLDAKPAPLDVDGW